MGTRVLIVDDHPETVRLIRSGLEDPDRPARVVSVPSAEEALLETRLQKFDLLVTEIRLPGISGLDLVSRLRETLPDMPVIVTTRQMNAATRKRIDEAGVSFVLKKPFEFIDFLDLFERAIGLVESGIILIPDEDDHPEQTISNLLAGLRNELRSNSVVLINDLGHISFQAGDFPEDVFTDTLMPSLMASLSAGQKVGRVLGQDAPQSWMIFHGPQYDIIAANIGFSYGLVVTTGAHDRSRILSGMGESLERTGRQLFEVLSAMGVMMRPFEPKAAPDRVAEEAIESSEPQAAIDEELDQLLEQTEGEEVDLDSFWEPSEEAEDSQTPVSSDALSYDQAVRLGFLEPPEE